MAREEVLGLVLQFPKTAWLCYLEKHSPLNTWASNHTESKVMGLEREILKVSC